MTSVLIGDISAYGCLGKAKNTAYSVGKYARPELPCEL